MTPEIKQELYDVIAKIYALDGVGGALHIVLDDLNVEDHHIKWCINEWLPKCQYTDEEQALYRRCAELLLMLHRKQRAKVIDKAMDRIYKRGV